jgi:gas vesicle protein
MNFTLPWTASNGHANGVTEKLEDVRSALGREVDHLAEVAAQMGRDAGTQAEGVAHDVARDAQKQTHVAVNRIADLAATLGPAIATLGRQKMRQVGEQAQTLGSELRQVRLTTEPKRNDALPGIALIGGMGIGVGAGIAAMYLLDPDRGRARRAVLRDKLGKWLRSGRETAEGKAKDLRNRTVGVMAEARKTVTSGIGVPDEPLIAEELESSYQSWPEGTRVPTVS